MYLILSFLFFDRGSVFLPSTESQAERRCLTFTPPALEDGTLNCHVMMSDIWDPVDFNRGKVKVSDSPVSCDITSQAIMRAGRLGMTLHQVQFETTELLIHIESLCRIKTVLALPERQVIVITHMFYFNTNRSRCFGLYSVAAIRRVSVPTGVQDGLKTAELTF